MVVAYKWFGWCWAGGHFLLSIYVMGGKSSNLEEKSETSGTHKGLTYTYIGYEKYKRISSILKREELKIVLFVLFPSFLFHFPTRRKEFL
jgi:hypothetical protein